MKTPIFLCAKFWKKHIKNALALLFAGTLLTAVVFVHFMSSREAAVRDVYSCYEASGRYEVIIGNSNDRVLGKLTEGKSGYNYGFINVLGTMGNAVNSYLYGTVSDEHDIYFIPLDEGRMPETADELAVDRGVLNALFWAGKCGDRITLNGKTYQVVGIINEEFGRSRRGSQLNESSSEYGMSDGHGIPLIFIGGSNETPLYRVDFLNNFFGGETASGLDGQLKDRPGEYYYAPILRELLNDEQWYHTIDKTAFQLSVFDEYDEKLFLYIAYIGTAISVLSVFSVLRSIFAERRGRIETLKKIGAKSSVIARMYAFECAAFAILQTALGIISGLAVYGGIYLFRTGVLGAKPYSGFENIPTAREHTRDPFLYACVISAALFAAAYLITVLTADIKPRKRIKNKKPSSLPRCFGKAFSQGGVTVVQTAALTLICFSVTLGYLYYTDNGKDPLAADQSGYLPETVSYEVGRLSDGKQIDMEENNVAEFYSCAAPLFSGVGHMDNPRTAYFYSIVTDFSRGTDDSTVSALPDNAYSTGLLTNTFIAYGEPDAGYGNEIDLSNEIVREGIIQASSGEYKDFFDEGETGSKHMYQAPTKLASAPVLNRLYEYVEDGGIDLDRINEGKELIVVYQSKKPSFGIGDKVTVYSAAAGEQNVGIGGIVSAEVTVGAVVRLPDTAGALLNYSARDLRDGYTHNFLTTATGADAMGLPCAKYTEVFTEEKTDGGIFPLSAEMELTSLEKLKHDNFITRAAQLSGIALVLTVMSLLGFSAYFNGIGMKIRMKSYNISVIRAVGASVSEIRKRLLLRSVKIPLIASALSYGLIRLLQSIMRGGYDRYAELMTQAQNIKGTVYDKWQTIVFADPEYYFGSGGAAADMLYAEMSAEVSAIEDKAGVLRNNMLFNGVMWQPHSEIPALVLFAVLCAVTFILTALALKRFRGSIAGDLNEERKRR